MKDMNGIKIIAVDHGYGNIKTANCCFKSGVAVYDAKPPLAENLLIYEGKYYLIGAKHKDYDGSKVDDDDYYVLTLAAIARELLRESLTSVKVFLAVGLPITWVVKQGAAFRDYLLKNKSVEFNFRGVDYHIDFAGADVFPQGFAAVADKLRDFGGSHMLCDIGNGTMNLLRITDHHADSQQMFTEEFGTKECAAKMRAALMEEYQVDVDESILNAVMQSGTADVDEGYLAVMTDAARKYVREIFAVLRKHKFDPKLMRLYVVGGGGCLIKNFGEYDASRTFILDDICATAKGYEWMAEIKIRKSGGVV